jgi:GNAT superfamily N-acetyltransferase
VSVTIRPMRESDLPAAERLSDASFHELELRTFPRDRPDPEPRSPDGAEAWLRRGRHILSTDPAGCWVAEDETGMLGFATSLTRELMWILGTYAVRPDLQGQGIGKQLLEAASTHSRSCLRAMLSASVDPKAVRRYRRAGFSLHPQMLLSGTVDRSLLPVVEKMREGSAGDIDLMNSVDRQRRGAAHLVDHEVLIDLFRLTVTDSTTGSGYVYSDEKGVALLAASNRRTAQRLLWEALAGARPGQRFQVVHITAANEWAIDVGMEARLDLHTSGYLALRGMEPPTAYLHHGVFL